MSERTASDIAADLWKLRDEADALAHRTVSAVVDEMPDGVRTALQEATAALYFRESHKWEGKFWAIIRALSPEVERVLEERGAEAAYAVAHREDS
jgi:hypothetical protein